MALSSRTKMSVGTQDALLRNSPLSKMTLRYATTCLIVMLGLIPTQARSQNTRLRFELTTNLGTASGRIFVIISRTDRPEPRFRIGETGADAPPILARDLRSFGPGVAATIDRTAAIFPIANLDDLPPSDYYVQALFDSNTDLGSVNAPGNLYSDVQRVHLDPRDGNVIKLSLTKTVPPEELPAEDMY